MKLKPLIAKKKAAIARAENPRVGGSIPPLGTTFDAARPGDNPSSFFRCGSFVRIDDAVAAVRARRSKIRRKIPASNAPENEKGDWLIANRL